MDLHHKGEHGPLSGESFGGQFRSAIRAQTIERFISEKGLASFGQLYANNTNLPLAIYEVAQYIRDPAFVLDLLPSVIRIGAEGFARALSWAVFTRDLWTLAPAINQLIMECDLTTKIPSSREIIRLAQDPRYQYIAEIEPSENRQLEKETLGFKAFPCRIRAVPGRIYPDVRQGEEGSLFILTVNPSLLGEDVSLIMGTRSHVPGAFWYLKFHLVGKDAVVSEIQSDVYRHSSSRGVRENFKHADRLLLSTFEQYLLSLPEAMRPERLCVVTEDFLVKRWPGTKEAPSVYPGLSHHCPKISPATIQQRYANLCAKLKLNTETMITDAIESHNGKPMPFGRCLSKTLALDPRLCGKIVLQPPLGETIHNILANRTRNSFLGAPWARDLVESRSEKLVPGDFNIKVRTKVLPPKLMPLITPTLVAMHNMLVEEFPFVNQLESKISCGSTSGDLDWRRLIEAASSREPNGISWIHLPGRERHPIQIVPGEIFGAQGICTLGCKGAGVRDPSLEDDLLIPSGVFRLPIYRTESTGAGIPIESQKYWGGLTLSDAVSEFTKCLGIHLLMTLAEPEVLPAVPIPVSVKQLTQLPVWKSNTEIDLVPVREYCSLYLDREQQQFGVFESLSKFDLRISHIANRIFSDPKAERNTQDIKKEIDQIIGLIYQANNFESPATPEVLLPDILGKLGTVEILSYLAEIYSLNRETADRIVGDFTKRTLSTLAVIHGSGGHLGGAILPSMKLGRAVAGGAATPRNTDITGVFHDLLDAYVPCLNRTVMHDEGLDVRAEDHPAFLSLLQHADLHCWQDSVYWFQILLKGGVIHSAEELAEHPFGLPDIGMSREPSSPIYKRLISPLPTKSEVDSLSESYPSESILDPDLKSTYIQLFAKGTQAGSSIVSSNCALQDKVGEIFKEIDFDPDAAF